MSSSRITHGRGWMWSAVGLGLVAFSALAQTQPAAQPGEAPAAQASPVDGVHPEAQDRGWPREFQGKGRVVRVHQPQLEDWPKFGRIYFRAALAVMPEGEGEPVYGIIRASADTEIAFEQRLVVLTQRKIESIEFPGVEADEAHRLSAVVLDAMPPERPQAIALDRLVAELTPDQAQARPVEVAVAPPKIFSSTRPAVLVMFMGRPRFKPAPGGELLFAINTNWDIFLDPVSGRHYLLNERSWLMTDDLEKGRWVPAGPLPKGLAALPADENWSDVRAALPGVPAKDPPTVFVSTQPAELIVTQGEPEFEPVVGAKLMRVANTDSDLFYHATEQRYYFLSAGRWFRAASPAGPWSAASADLPAEFALIPEDSDSADVLASVPGTEQAQEAVVMASIPQKAVISRVDATLAVTYNGEPDFRPIEGTVVRYAHNSPFSVFLVDGRYFCCHNGVWFESASAKGPWAVCDAVPPAIYTIPPTSPKYNVTYVTVYDSTPTTVTTGYTAGYSGATVAATGVVMFGLGVLVGAAIDNDDCCWAYHYHPGYFSYGCGAVYVGAYGGYAVGARYYGPYGGAGRWATYNPATGIYSRGGYAYGPRGAAGYRAAYNPATGNAAYRAGGSSVYGSWGRAAVSNGENWVRAGYTSGARGTVSGVQGSGGAGAVHAEGKFNNGVTVARSRDGDVYASKDGNVYKKTDSGWSQAGGSGTRPPRTAPPSGTTRPKPENMPASRPTTTRSSTGTVPSADVQRSAASRERGERNVQRTQHYQRSGGGMRSGGGGRRRP
jgi:hypothetical protein